MRYRALIIFLLSLAVYLLCLDPEASLWDCPEYILGAWRLEVGHPPGNPTWQLIANVVAHAGGSPAHAAILINLISAVATALAATLLGEICYHFLRYTLFRGNGTSGRNTASFCSICGALCFAWCDSVIFSAVEAEVYALSVMITALMLWLAVKWAQCRVKGADRTASRIAILTWYIAGLAMGVHELNLLVLPALILIYWYTYRRLPASRKVIGRTFGTTFLGLLFFCIGCTTFLIIPIRAAAGVPINTGNPSGLESFISYYSRDQYGSKPLLYGQTPYSKPLLKEEFDSAGNPVYSKYYVEEGSRGKKNYVYPEELNMWFPRMTSNDEQDIVNYEAWAGIGPDDWVKVEASEVVDSAGKQQGRIVDAATGRREKKETYRPTYPQQLRFMLSYQVGYMYLRYLLWNFAGRQNNIPSTGEIDHGNFITGIPPVDDMMLGAQSQLPSELKEDNRGYNRYFMIPLLFGVLGAVGLLREGRRGRRLCLIIATLFIMTGVAIVIYLNQDPGEPRERDYSFLGSYLAFAIWIAFGMGFLMRYAMELCLRKKRRRWLLWCMGAVCAAVPVEMLSQTYDDHDRSGREVPLAVASNILNSLDENAIIFVEGDNLIFPLWYAQEVHGIRPDVTVIETGYLVTDWYRRQLRIPKEKTPGLMISEEIPPGGGTMLERAVKDVILSNSSGPNARPVYWHNGLAKMAPFVPFEEESDLTLFAHKYRGSDTVNNPSDAMEESLRGLRQLRSGGTENPRFYAEPAVAEALGMQRRSVLKLSQRVRESGDSARADSIVKVAYRLWPFVKVPPIGHDHLPKGMKGKRQREFQRYYDAMPANRRVAISSESMGVLPVVSGH